MKHQKVSAVNKTCSTFIVYYPVIKLGKAPTHTQADMEYEPVGTQGEKQSIELQSNAAYASSVM